jgi:diacylglycerol kinase (ATP)
VTLPFGVPLVIANPSAGRGGPATLDRLRRALDARDVAHDVVMTDAPGAATRIAREAVRSGRRYVVAVGGDGTVHEVVNGLVDAEAGRPHAEGLVLGVVSSGSGCDLVRTFGLDRDPEVLAGHLASDDVLPIDLGRVRLTGPDGRPTTRVFANIAEVGFGGQVARTAQRLPARLGPARYSVGIVATWGAFRRVPTRIVHDGGVHEGPVCNVVVANGQFFGGGMHVAPRALPTDGRFNLQAWVGSPTDVVRASRQLRTGAHLSRPDVHEWQSAEVTIEGTRTLAVEADGEPIGTGPARFDVLPRAIGFKL